MDIHKELDCIFLRFGYDLDDNNSLAEIDSISFISIVVEIERVFDVEIPDENLTESLLSKTTLSNIIESLL